MVGSVAQNGVEQVAVGTMEFNAVESGFHGAGAGVSEVRDDARYLVESECAGRRYIDKSLAGQEGLGVSSECGRTDWRRAAVVKTGVRDPARMPKLNDHRSALGMDSIGDPFPAPHLVVRVAARRIGVALRLRRDLSGFGNDRPSRGPLSIIFSCERTWDQPSAGAVTGERRHDDTISEPKGARAGGFEKRLGRAGRMMK